MSDEQNTNTQSQNIDTSQPTPLRGLVLRGVKSTSEVLCVKKGAGRDGEDVFYKIASADFDSESHTKAEEEKLPTRKKKSSKKAAAVKPLFDDTDDTDDTDDDDEVATDD